MTATLRLVGNLADSEVDPDIDAYLAWGRDLRNFRPVTIRVRGQVLVRLGEHLGKPLREATDRDPLRWEQVAVAGRKPETRRAFVSHVRMFHKWAKLSGLIESDPSMGLTNPRLTRALPRPMDEKALRRAVEAARPKKRLMILLGAFCGLRCQEIAGLHWTDLLVSPTGDTTLLVREGKGGKERIVPVPGVVLEAIDAHGRKRSGPMFYGLDAAQIDPKSVSRSLNAHFERLGIDATAHQLRHRYGTTTYQITKDLRLVQELLGHGSPNTTARYAAYDKSQTVDMVKAMDETWTVQKA